MSHQHNPTEYYNWPDRSHGIFLEAGQYKYVPYDYYGGDEMHSNNVVYRNSRYVTYDNTHLRFVNRSDLHLYDTSGIKLFDSGTLMLHTSASDGPGVSRGFIVDEYGRVGVGMNHTQPQSAHMERPSFDLDVRGTIGVENYVYHNEDTDTYMLFGSDNTSHHVNVSGGPDLNLTTDYDEINFRAGGVDMLQMIEGSQDRVIINKSNNDVDTIIRSATNSQAMIIRGDGSEVVVNESGQSDTNFRIESNTSPVSAQDPGENHIGHDKTHAFFVDTSTGNVGLGVDTPLTTLHVAGSAQIEGDLWVKGITNQFDTLVHVTSAMDIHNVGTGAALTVTQTGTQPIAAFWDQDPNGVKQASLYLADKTKAGIGTDTPRVALHVSDTTESADISTEYTTVQIDHNHTHGGLSINSPAGDTQNHVRFLSGGEYRWQWRHPLHVEGVEGEGDTLRAYSRQLGEDVMTMTNEGHVGVGTVTPRSVLDVNGLLTGGIGAATTSGTVDWNHSTNARGGQGHTLLYGNATNGPGIASKYYHPFSFEYNKKDGTGNLTQFAIPYNTHDGPFFRWRYNDSWSDWAEMWNSRNDGSGSGLDADLLDNLDSTQFLRSDVSDSYTGSGVLTMQSSAARQLTIAGTHNEKLALEGAAGQSPYMRFVEGDVDKGYIQWNGGGYMYLRNQEDASGIRIRDNFDFTYDGTTFHKIWHAGNDGAGSGLDADLLDGLSSASFLRSDVDDVAAGNIVVEKNLQSLMQIRATGWWNTSGGPSGDLGTEIGVSGGKGYLMCYDRLASAYGDLNISGKNINISEQGGTTTIENNEVLHAGNYTSYVKNATLTVQGTGALGGSGTFTANQGTNTTISISHDDTSTQNSVNNSGGSVIQDVSLDGYGHVTGLTSYNLDGRYYTETESDSRFAANAHTHDDRYYTETESDSRFVNVTGDTMTGNLTVQGTIQATGDVVAFSSSDERLKDNLKPITDALDKTLTLTGYEFDWNDNQDIHQGHDVGVVAQEVEQVLPDIVVTRDDGYKAVKYERLVPLLIESVKSQQQQIDLLKQQVELLKQQL